MFVVLVMSAASWLMRTQVNGEDQSDLPSRVGQALVGDGPLHDTSPVRWQAAVPHAGATAHDHCI